VLVEDYCNFSSQHDGPCCIGKPPIPLLQPKNLRLLLDKKGNPRGPDTACFGSVCVADGDAGAVKAFMKKQNEIMGVVADGESIYVPDLGHTIKNSFLLPCLYQRCFCHLSNIIMLSSHVGYFSGSN
jgi:hypothetical protein